MKASQQMITAMPEIREQELQEDDEFLILACDGIWENLSSQQVRLLLARRARCMPWALLVLVGFVWVHQQIDESNVRMQPADITCREHRWCSCGCGAHEHISTS
jgi:Protein phosphatase 2C